MPQQPIIKQFSGVLNTDDSDVVMPLAHHKMAKNIRFRGNGSNRRAEIVEGNILIPNNYLPSVGSNECIGSFFDPVKQRVIWFNYNSQGRNGIYWLNLKTKEISSYLLCFTDSADDILEFSLDYPIPSVNIIYATDDIGDTLCWTDRLNRPMKLNLKQAVDQQYGSAWVQDYLTVARTMPLICPSCRYVDDSTVSVNNLRKTLYEFRYKYVYRDNTESCWSPYSKLFAPLDPDSLSTNVDPTKNNRIDVTINTGAADCVEIKIAARRVIGAYSFSDSFLVASLNKADLGISDDALYTYQFFNDSSYPFVDVADNDLLFDYVPKKANAQELLNGNVIIYGGVTEGANFDVDIDVSSDITLFTNGVEPLTVQSSVAGVNWDYVFFGTPNTGDVITIDFNVLHDDNSIDSYSFTYTVLGGDTLLYISQAFEAQIDATPNLHATQLTPSGGGYGFRVFGDLTNDIIQDGTYTINYAGTVVSTDDVSNSVYKNKSKYRFFLIYFDEFGVTNGAQTVDELLVTTLELDTTGGTKMKANNIAFSLHNQPPMNAKYFTWGRSLNLTVDSFITLISATTVKDTDYGYLQITNLQTNQNNYPTYSFAEGDRIRIIGEFVNGMAGTVNVLDFPITDLVTDPTVSSVALTGDFIKIPYDSSLSNFGTTMNYYCEIYTPAQRSELATQVAYEFGETYSIINPGTANRAHQGKRQNQIPGTSTSITAPSSSAVASLIVSAGNLGIGTYSYYVEYVNASGVSSAPSPLSNIITTISGSQRINLASIPVSADPLVTARKIYRTTAGGGIYYLLTTIAGNVTTTYQDNIADASLGVQMPQPAIYDFARGDVYLRNRKFPISADLATIKTMYLLNAAVSDLYSSTIVGNGRAFPLATRFDVETFFGTTLRWGLAYQQNTNLNQINKFYPNNQTDIDKAKGDIQRLMTEDRLLYTYQNKGVGQFGIYARFIQNNSGDSQLVTTDEIITTNNINYLQGVYGLGDQYCSLTRSQKAHYFADPILGANIRRSANGLTNLSELYKGQFTINKLITPYNKTWTQPNGSKAKILGFYDFFEEEYHCILQGGYNGTDEVLNYNFSFNEPRTAYCSFYDYHPEWATCANNLIYTWKNGQLYEHSNKKYGTFYDTKYGASVTSVFNEQELINKNFLSVGYQANQLWISPVKGDVYTSYKNPQTGFIQESKLPLWSYEVQEDKRIASLLRDMNSLTNQNEALNEGDFLTGFNIVINFQYLGDEFAWIYAPYITWSLNNRQF